MFGPLGFPELIFLLVLALLIFGPKKLPEIGRTLGKGLAEFRKASNELKRTINAEMEDLREADPRRLLRDEPPRRPLPKKTEGPAKAPETTGSDARVARGETGETTAETVTAHSTEPVTDEPATNEPVPRLGATPTAATETP